MCSAMRLARRGKPLECELPQRHRFRVRPASHPPLKGQIGSTESPCAKAMPMLRGPEFGALDSLNSGCHIALGSAHGASDGLLRSVGVHPRVRVYPLRSICRFGPCDGYIQVVHVRVDDMTAVWVTPDVLHKIPIFRYLGDGAINKILRSSSNRIIECHAGDMVFKEGEIGDCMYLILDGAVEVFIRTVGGRQISMQTLKAGGYFGEQSLLPGGAGKRNASVRCLGATKLFRISKPDVLLGLKGNPDFTPSWPKAIASFEHPEVHGLLRGVRLLRGLTDLEADTMSQWTEVIECEPGQFIFKEGQIGDALYVVLEGRVEIFIVSDLGKVITLEVLRRGSYFGEQALLPGGSGKRNANARTDDEAKLIKIAKSAFLSILKRDPKLIKALSAVGQAQKKEITKLRSSSDATD